VVEKPPTEGLPSAEPAVRARTQLADESPPIGFLLHLSHGAELEIELEHRAHRLGFDLVDRERSAVRLVAERDGASHPHALALRSTDLVADPLAGDLALELRKREQHVQGEAAHRGRRVELLRDRHERHPARIEHLHDLREVGEGAREPIDLVDDNGVELSIADVGEQLCEPWPIHRATGVPAVVVARGDKLPALPAWLRMYASQASRCASSELKSCSSPSSDDLRV